MTSRYVVFSHGQGDSLWGRPFAALADVARSEGYVPEGVDYRGVDSPKARIAHLVEFCKELQGDLVLVGTGLGGYVSVASASLLHARGTFLLAPQIYSEGLPALRAGIVDCPTAIVHGWRDETVPFADSVRFAQAHRTALHLLDGDHDLHNQIRLVCHLFEFFLIALDLPERAFE